MRKALLGVVAVMLIGCMAGGCISPVLPIVSSGSLDTSFNSPNGFFLFNSVNNNKHRGVEVAIQADGKIVVLGYSYNGLNEDVLLARFNGSGRLDTGFGKGGYVVFDGGGNDRGLGLALQRDGKIITTGYTYVGSQRDVLLLRYNVDGSIDSTFGAGGKVTYSSQGSATDIGFGVVVQEDNGIVVVGETSVGSHQDVLVLRYTGRGTLDDQFGSGGIVRYGGGGMDRGFAAAIQSDGKIVVVGSNVVKNRDDVLVLRLTASGALDKPFGTDGAVIFSGAGDNSDYGNWVALQADGKIVVSGAISNGTAFDILLLRFNSNGTPDSSFGTRGVVVYGDGGGNNDYGFSHVIQADGKIVIAGYTQKAAGDDVILIRFGPEGKPDPTFGLSGSTTWNGSGNGMDFGQGLALQPDGRLVVTGFSHNGANEDLLVMRFMP
jgi:uncharacterized delta-60 repeat protein